MVSSSLRYASAVVLHSWSAVLGKTFVAVLPARREKISGGGGEECEEPCDVPGPLVHSRLLLCTEEQGKRIGRACGVSPPQVLQRMRQGPIDVCTPGRPSEGPESLDVDYGVGLAGRGMHLP